MFKKFLNKLTTRRPSRKRGASRGYIKKFWAHVCNVARRTWCVICSINLIGLINIALLCAIIALFSMLIIDVCGYGRKTAIIVANPNPIPIEEKNRDDVKIQPVAASTLPIVRNMDNKYTQKPVHVVPVKKCTITERQTARRMNKLYGDIIIDNRGAGAILKHGDTVHGNLFLQNMRKYTLPCNIRVNGNLFLRDLNLLQFCGEFTVTGNIYVSPRSSFGPLPRNARIGGHVIL